MSSISVQTIFLSMDGGLWCLTFWFVKSLHNNMVYTFGRDVTYVEFFYANQFWDGFNTFENLKT